MVMPHRQRGLPVLQTSVGEDCREVITVCCQNHTEHTYALSGKHEELLMLNLAMRMVTSRL
jgi:hypothetical protein